MTINNSTEEVSVAVTETSEATTMEITEADNQNTDMKTPQQQQDTEKKVTNFNGNLLYEESLGSIPHTLRAKQDPRYVFAKFHKQYKNFDFTNEDILQILEEADLLKYLQLLQISKPNKSTDILFRTDTEDAADFFVIKHVEIRGKPIPLIRKAKRILKVTVKRVHPELDNDELMFELMPYVEHTSSGKM